MVFVAMAGDEDALPLAVSDEEVLADFVAAREPGRDAGRADHEVEPATVIRGRDPNFFIA